MNRCYECGAFLVDDECPHDHDELDIDESVYEAPRPEPVAVPERAPLPVSANPRRYRQGEWCSVVHVIGEGHGAEDLHSPAQVVAQVGDIARVCVYTRYRTIMQDVPATDLLPPVNPLEGEPDGD